MLNQDEEVLMVGNKNFTVPSQCRQPEPRLAVLAYDEQPIRHENRQQFICVAGLAALTWQQASRSIRNRLTQYTREAAASRWVVTLRTQGKQSHSRLEWAARSKP